MNRFTGSILGLLVLVVLFFAVNILSGAALRTARIDLTENKLYTLSDGAANIASALQDDVRLRYFFSKSLVQDRPALKGYGQRVRELLEEFVRASGDRLSLEIIDPEPFSESEDDAVAGGLRGLPGGARGENIFCGLIGTNSIDGKEVIPYFDQREEEFLEYELARMIYTLANPDRKVIGLISSIPVRGAAPNPMQPQGEPAWQSIVQLEELFEVRDLAPASTTTIPPDIDVLLVVHPKSLPADLQYGIDQYVLGGGNAIVFVDPHCEKDLPPNGQDPMAAFQAERGSNLEAIFTAWGLKMDPNEIVTDMGTGQMVTYQTSTGQRDQTTYLVWLSLGEAQRDPDDAVVGRLSTLNVASAGSLLPASGATTTFTPLVFTSAESSTTDLMSVKIMADPKALITDFEADGLPRTIAARIQGDVQSAFPDRAGEEGHVAASVSPISVIVVSDVDILHDQYWIRVQNLLGMRMARPFADNGSLLTNAVDNLVGSQDLISVRARGKFVRPFTRVVEIRKKAEEQYLTREKELQDKLRETERNINQLQSQKSGEEQLIMSAEQQAEIERFNEEKIETRKKLREVQLSMRKDIENLGTRIKILNIGLVPALLALLAISLGVVRVSRRAADRRSVAQT